MTKVAEKIIDEIRRLDVVERQEVVCLLHDEFGTKDPGYDQAWAKEIQRREEKLAAGRAKLIPAEEVVANMQRIIEEKRASVVR